MKKQIVRKNKKNSITNISFKNNLNGEHWSNILMVGERIDDYYNRNKYTVTKHYSLMSELLDNYCKSKAPELLSLQEWTKLHIETHASIINYDSAIKDNIELNAKHIELLKEIQSLKNTLIENYVNIPSSNTFYS